MFCSAHALELATPTDLAQAVGSRLPMFKEVHWVAATGSTNADLLARSRAGNGNKPWLIGAHVQHTGRGRAGRSWQNRIGAALMFSCAFDVHVSAAQLPALSPLAGMAACEALRQLAGPFANDLYMKWPNDVQRHDAKLAGVLVESARNPGGEENGHTVVIGIGINLRDATMLSQELGRPVADWARIMEQSGLPPPTAADLVSATAAAWHDTVQQFEVSGMTPFKARLAQVDALAGRAINVIERGTIVRSGIACGLDEQGRLLVRTGEVITPVLVSEVSIRPHS
jgi:BirA family biotin operon repressor/biotin-[acetyl-CoA-carboxylase] ligase